VAVMVIAVAVMVCGRHCRTPMSWSSILLLSDVVVT